MPRRRRGSHLRAGPSQAPRRSSSPASFNSLPPELRLKIAFHTRDYDKWDDDGSYARKVRARENCMRARAVVKAVRALAFRGDSDGQEAGMLQELWDQVMRCKSDFTALSLVDRATYAALRHEIWRHVDLAGRSTTSMLFFVQYILPRQADCVASLAWSTDDSLGNGPFFEDWDDETEERTPVRGFRSREEQRVVEATERLTSMPPHGSDGLRRFVPYKLPTHQSGCPAFLHNYALVPLLEASSRLTTLRVTVSPGMFKVLDLVFDRACMLERVHLESWFSPGEEAFRSSEFSSMLKRLAALKLLSVLKMDFPLPPPFYALTFSSSSLRYLRIWQPAAPPFFALRSFLLQFSSTLSRLELVFDPDRYSDRESPAPPPYGAFPSPSADGTYPPLDLPHLERLHLGVGFERHSKPEKAVIALGRQDVRAFLGAFSLLPLKILRISLFPVFDKTDLDLLGEVVQTLTHQHPGKLKTVEVAPEMVRVKERNWHGGTYLGRNYTLDEACRQAGVQLRLLGKGGELDDYDEGCMSCYDLEEDARDVSEEEWD
ncbi:hypothetical protein JCM8097_003723 [Rhodosporidiobolus ruineniae]